MSIKCSAYMATSVDGFIAKPDGDIEWLHLPEYLESDFNGLQYEDFISTVDTLIMGRNTFEKILTFDSWPYEGTPVVVVTSRELTIHEHLQGKVSAESGDPEKLVSKLESEGSQHLYIDGGKTIQRFLQAGLINEITITRIPILLGDGISLFNSFGVETSLRLIDATTTDNGFVQVRYEVKPRSQYN